MKKTSPRGSVEKEDARFRVWIQRLPSCISGQFSEYVNGEGRNPACHVRRAATSGTGFKAPFSCVPLTHKEHTTQHTRGELACLMTHLKEKDYLEWFYGTEDKERAAKHWFDCQAEGYRIRWEKAGRP